MKLYFFLKSYELEKIHKGEEEIWKSPSLCWIWMTYNAVKSEVKHCELVSTIPNNGIIVLAGQDIPMFYKVNSNAFLISVAADSPPRIYPHIHISQNPSQSKDYRKTFNFPVWKYIPHWPQPYIIGRDIERKDTFKNIGYLGSRNQLAKELQSEEFIHELNSKGFNFIIEDNNFNDYSQLDAVLAVRSFEQNEYLFKPASKLINAWHAGVPVILGKESAYEALKESDLDYLEVHSKEDVIKQLLYLKNNIEVRHKMVVNGRKKALFFRKEDIANSWVNFFLEELPKAYTHWNKKNIVQKKLFYIDQFSQRMMRSLIKKIF